MKKVILGVAAFILNFNLLTAQNIEKVKAYNDNTIYWLYLQLMQYGEENLPDFIKKDEVEMNNKTLEKLTDALKELTKHVQISEVPNEFGSIIYCEDESAKETLIQEGNFKKLLEKYGLETKEIGENAYHYGYYKEKAIMVNSSKFVNYWAFQNEFRTLFSQVSVNLYTIPYEHKIGASSGQYVVYDHQTNEIIITNWVGWGDCPAGCIHKEYQYHRYNFSTGAYRYKDTGQLNTIKSISIED